MAPEPPERLRIDQLKLPPLSVRAVKAKSPKGGDNIDALLEIEWSGQKFRFLAKFKRNAKPQTLQLAVEAVKAAARAEPKTLPLIVAPYLDEAKLDQLIRAGVSAIDLCGNGAVGIPGKLLVFRTGQPNQFQEQAPLEGVYRGDSSLVARALLLRPQFTAIGDIGKFIAEHGGKLTFSAVSKALKRLQEDLVIDRPSKRSVRLIQPEKLLDQLSEGDRPPKAQASWLGKVDIQPDQLVSRLEAAETPEEPRIVRTGALSVSLYAVFAGEPVIEFYCREEPADVLRLLKVGSEETRRFPNVRLIQTADQRVYFDRRPGLTASPIQAWLELSRGDKRQQDAAAQMLPGLLRDVEVARA